VSSFFISGCKNAEIKENNPSSFKGDVYDNKSQSNEAGAKNTSKDNAGITKSQNLSKSVGWIYPPELDTHRTLAQHSNVALDSDKNILYTTNFEGILTAIDAATGKVAGEYKFSDMGMDSVEIVELGVHPNGNIYAYDFGNSKVLVINPHGELQHAIPFEPNENFIMTVPKFIFAKNGLVYFGGQDGKVYCIDEKGNIIWNVLIGKNKDTNSIQPVTELCISNDEGLIIAVSSFTEYNPVYGIDARTGEIKWEYINPKFKYVSYMTKDGFNNIILAANDPKQSDIWYSTDPDAPDPPFDKINTIIGGSIILLDSNGNENSILEIPNEVGIELVKPDPLHKRLIAICSTYVKEKSLLSPYFLFIADYEGNIIKGKSVDMSMEVLAYESEDNILVDGDCIYVGSDDGLKKFDIDGNLTDTYDIVTDKKIETRIYQTDPGEKAIYLTGTGEQISDEQGRSLRIFKYYYGETVSEDEIEPLTDEELNKIPN
jgi:outer membrane protein assembly factor BamB